MHTPATRWWKRLTSEETLMGIQLGMVALDVRDVDRSIDFYRHLGLEVPDCFPDRRATLLRMDSGVTLVLIEGFAAAHDAAWRRPEGGYQQLLEFFAEGDAAVDALHARMTQLGYHSRMSPQKTTGPYAAMIDDPDGNVVLISSDEAADPAQPPQDDSAHAAVQSKRRA